MNKPIVTFLPKLPKLTKTEKAVLKLLIEAGKLVALVYEEQENHKFPGANFYPHDATKEEIEKAAKMDPAILSPYTVVERKDGKLIAVPYHEKYKNLLAPVAEKLNQAAKISQNRDFAQRLQVQAETLLSGNYEKATISWMTMKPNILDMNIGPIERYDDKLFFVKTAYQAWVGVMDQKNTHKVNDYQKMILSAKRKVSMPSEKVDYYDKVQIRIDETLLFSGLIARTMFVGVNLPNDPNLMERYGSEITIFKQVNDYRFKNEILPAFEKNFSPDFKKLFTLKEIKDGSLYLIVLHELAHTYLRYRDTEKRLKDLFPIIDELAAYIMGIKVCGSLLLKDAVTTKQLEAIMLSFIARSFYLILHEKENHSKYHYVMGSIILINYLLESEAIKSSRGISWPNFMKMYFSFDELASILGRLLSWGTYSDAQAFIKKYGHMDHFKKMF